MASGIEIAAVNVAATATLLAAVDPHRRALVIHNQGGAEIFVGPSTVATTTGLTVPDGEKIAVYWAENDMGVTEAWYAIAADLQVAPANTRVLRVVAL